MRFSTYWVAPLALLFTFILSGCGSGFSPASSQGPATAEPGYYESPVAVTNGLTFSVTTDFEHRPLVYSGNQPVRLSASTAVRDMIHYAEFHIYDSSGNRIQQGNTGTGNPQFTIPRTLGTYTLKVFSRSNNDYIKVSVLKDPYNNEPHSISLSFTITSGNINSNSTINLGTLTAKASEGASAGIEGGAFNIHHDIFLANEYIRNQLNKTTLNSNWWVADKVTAFWKAGFNPGTYYNSTAALSFYVPGDHELYILGGINDNVSSVDTDHFDDSVILHEYGHFLEDVYSRSQSPGGSHDGNFVIDPRLAWSEGWATFFQAAVMTYSAGYTNGIPSAPEDLHTREYVDTRGYGNSGGLYNRIDLLDGGRDSLTYDRSTAPLEGHFRESSISRTLYKMSRTPASTWTVQSAGATNSGANISFENFWAVLAEFKADIVDAANMGEFNQRLLTILGSASSAWTDIMTEEMHGTTNSKYASTPLKNCTIETRTLTGAEEKTPAYAGATAKSDMYANNDFFLYYYSGGAETLSLLYRTTVAPTNSSGVVMNMDLIVYRGFYVYQEDLDYYSGRSSSYIAKQSRTEASLETSCLSGYNCETVTLTGLAPGYYMINAKINGRKPNGTPRTSAEINGTVEYALRSSVGNYLCIAN